MLSLLFNPTPEAAAQILERFTCPQSSLSNIAAEYDTTLDALCAWMATDEVQERLRNSENQAAARTRLAASHRMHFAIEALLEMLAGYTHSERKVPMIASLAHIECRERQRANARRAAFLFHKLSRSYPPLPPVARLAEPRDSSNVRRVRTVEQPVIDASASPAQPSLPDTTVDESLAQLAPPTPAMEPDIFAQLVGHEPSPAEEGFEPFATPRGDQPAYQIPRSDISDLKSMSGAWAPRPNHPTVSPRPAAPSKAARPATAPAATSTRSAQAVAPASVANAAHSQNTKLNSGAPPNSTRPIPATPAPPNNASKATRPSSLIDHAGACTGAAP